MGLSTIEDLWIVLLGALKQVTGDWKGIPRFSHAIVPMDESISVVVLNCDGRGCLVFNVTRGNRIIENIPADVFEDFFIHPLRLAGIIAPNALIWMTAPSQCEAIFKAF